MQLVAFQILQIAQRNKKQHYRLNGLLMDLMDSASAVSNGTSKEEKFPPHRDSWEKVNGRHQGTLLLCKRTQWQDLKPLEKSLNFQGLVTEPCPCHRLSSGTTAPQNPTEPWAPWSGPFDSAPCGRWGGIAETEAGSLQPFWEGGWC